MAQLILIRHGQSLWNAANKFTGWVDVPLSPIGRAEAIIASHKLRHYRVRLCFTSMLFRAIETAIVILTEADDICDGRTPILKHDKDDVNWHGWDQYEGDCKYELPVYTSAALDERYYGELQGLNKAEMAEKYGDEQVHLWRRSYAVRPPGGESLEDTKDRTLPFFRDRIMKHLKQGDNVLIAAHGNSLRSIIMELEHIPEVEIPLLELTTGVPIIYDLNAAGAVTQKRVLS